MFPHFRICVLLEFALILGLPFEYYFRTPEQSLYSSLKLQLFLFLGCWGAMKLVETRKGGAASWLSLVRSLPARLWAALILFVVIQALAAALAPELRWNAAKAALKAALGACLFLAAVDLSRAPGSVRSRRAGWFPLAALSAAGTLVALVGLGDIAGIGFCERLVYVFQTQRFHVASQLRLSSTMEYPNTAGSFLAASIFASVGLMSTIGSGGRHGRILRSLVLLASAFSAAALILTQSRGAIVSAVLALLAPDWVARKANLADPARNTRASSYFIVGFACAVLLYLWADFTARAPQVEKRAALFRLHNTDSVRRLEPSREYREQMVVRNQSSSRWFQNDFGIACRWYSLSMRQSSSSEEAAAFSETVLAGEELELAASFTTPSQAGEYLLIWFVFQRDAGIRELEGSFAPAILCVIDGAASLSDDALRNLKLIQGERWDLAAGSAPKRMDLWRAALAIFRDRPILGVGPDNFRILKWKYMAMPEGETRLLAHSLYLEFLSGSGILGLISLLWLLWEIGRQLLVKLRAPDDRAWSWFGIAYFVSLLIHGFVDYFLKFTPHYILFWVMLGGSCSMATDAEGDEIA